MVSLALLLLTVSTLATHSNAFPKELRQCKDGAACDIKPNGYPQEEIDRAVLKHLPHLQRMKRYVGEWRTNRTNDGNCRIRTRQIQIYNPKKVGGLSQVIVRSKWFNQTLTEVECAEDVEPSTKGCLSEYALRPVTTTCATKYMSYELLTYDLITKELITSSIDIGVECACVLID